MVDSHTEGEPTRVILEGGPDLGTGPLSGRRDRFLREHDRFRSAVASEPRGSDPVVGAMLCPPEDSTCATGVIFFNNVGYLGMCGHGTMGVVATLAWLGRIGLGAHRIETPVGVVTAYWHGSGAVSVVNVPSRRFRRGVSIETEAFGAFTGDVAWGGNWFYLLDRHGEELALERVGRLSDVAWAIRRALAANGVTGEDGAEIDHIELFGPPRRPGADSRNFVLCPGGAYDRSPCGTGTCAKMACLHEDGKLEAGQIWRQESIVGSLFEGWIDVKRGRIEPTIKGSAYVTAESTLVLDERDPFCWGIRP